MTTLTHEQIEELKAIRRLYLKGIQIVPNEARKTYFQGDDAIVATCCYFGAVAITL